MELRDMLQILAKQDGSDLYLSTTFSNVFYGLNGITVSKDARCTFPFCPSAISVHNNGYMFWQIIEINIFL